MKTRSQTKVQLYEVDIDFDGASETWRANKRSIENGHYKYVCQKKGKTDKFCAIKCMHGENFCKTHLKMFLEGKF